MPNKVFHRNLSCIFRIASKNYYRNNNSYLFQSRSLNHSGRHWYNEQRFSENSYNKYNEVVSVESHFHLYINDRITRDVVR
jgi:hypothetical protein